MPSWNIHTAHVERLLAEEGADALGIRDANAFLMGNLVPDIYVGYMVENVSTRIDYKLTHLTMREHIPVPRYQEYWDFYMVNPAGYGAGTVTDMVKGAWCHLVCDAVYNKHTREHLKKLGIAPGEKMRIAKQSDFATFGRTLKISLKPKVTEALVQQGRDFPMYTVHEADLMRAACVASRIVDENIEHAIAGEPDYSLLTAEFFETARAEAHKTMVEGLTACLQA